MSDESKKRELDEPHTGADSESTTGTGENETSVGRVAGQDEGYLETGAEKRADMEDSSGTP